MLHSAVDDDDDDTGYDDDDILTHSDVEPVKTQGYIVLF